MAEIKRIRKPRIRVLIVDDDLFVRETLAEFVGTAADLELVGTCADGAEAVIKARRECPDVVLMDLRMPVVDGLTATREILEIWPQTKVIALTSLDDGKAFHEMFAIGAAGFLVKTTRPHALVEAIRAAHSGMAVAPADFINRWNARPPGAENAPVLTARERYVLNALAEGQTNVQISRDLFVSASTIKSIVAALMHKFEVSNRSSLVSRAHELKLL